jgi:sialate O-acetylesterase
MNIKIVLCMTAGLLLGFQARADVRLAGIFGTGMVLQQKKPVPIWGWAEPGEAVTVKIADQTASTQTDADGKWKVVLKPLQVGAPLELSVTGKNVITLRDVLVGEVWLCSGQSNMEISMSELGSIIDPELALPANPNLRMIRVSRGYSDKPEKDIRGGSWQSASPKTLRGFCSTAYFFGKYLQRELGVPVGLIASTIGGTPVQAWISRDKLASDPETKALADQEIAAGLAGIEHNKSLAKDDKQRTPNWRIQASSSFLYNTMINPLIPYGIAGFAWYQGEGNEVNPEPYGKMFAQLITDWRSRWGDASLPFNFCQLPGTKANGKRAFLREGQASALSLPNTGMAVLIDTGEELSNHPHDKAPVGERLARIALAKSYGKKIEFAGPNCTGAQFSGAKVVLRYNNLAGGLVAKPLPADYQPDSTKPERKPLIKNTPESQVEGFAVAGSDRIWVWANAQIEGDTVVVSAPTVPIPVAVRYAWTDFPLCNLYSKAGLPAAPYRTDNWPITGK